MCPDYGKNLQFACANMAISVPCACLKPNWLSAVHRYLASRDSKTCSSTLERAVAVAIGLQLLTSAGSLDLHFSNGMITTCIRVLGSLPESIHPERNIDI